MKLQAFRINNFRSIEDSEWQNLSPDNITGIIGQNEAGKTAILEALYSFQTGEMLTDYLRSDGTMPEVACSFRVSWGEIKDLFQNFVIPDGLMDAIENEGRINLKRSWINPNESGLALDEAGFSALFSQEEIAVSAEVAIPATAVTNPKIPVSIGESVAKKLTDYEFVKVVFDQIPDFQTFEDFASLLPNTIDLEDLQNKNDKVEGYKGAKNLLAIAGLAPEFFQKPDLRIVENQIGRLNKTITTNFREFWSQKIGKGSKISIEFELKHHDQSKKENAGKPFLVFWISDGQEKLYPKQRSKGVRWFTSFYLQLKASSLVKGNRDSIFLIDEPGGMLHARAQEDVLKVFEEIKDKVGIIYTTHSPYLTKIDTIYRLLAIQRANEDDEKSETVVLDMHKLGAATIDTLSPIYTLMGIDFSSQQAVKNKDNVLLEEISAFYYLTAFWKFVDSKKEVHFLPATGVNNIPQLANLFLGWGLRFGVVVDDDSAGRAVYKEMKQNLYLDDDVCAKKHMLKIRNCSGIEDIFSKSDFKKYVLEDSGAPVSAKASEYMRGKPKAVFALKFFLKAKTKQINFGEFDEETQTNIRTLINEIEGLLI